MGILRFKIVAQVVTCCHGIDGQHSHDRQGQLPTFWVEATGQREAAQIAAKIIDAHSACDHDTAYFDTCDEFDNLDSFTSQGGEVWSSNDK